MGEHLFTLLRGYLVEYGYGAVAGALLLENAGLPVPGETVLLLASFLAFSEHRLHLPFIILVGVCAATLGDNVGYALGHYGGRPLLERYRKFFRIKASTIVRGEELFARHGAATVFVARFIAGLRVIAGPLAGGLSMHWRKFAFFNFLGAVLWVTVVASAGYFFGKHWDEVMRVVRNINIAVLVAAAGLLIFFWWRRRRR